VLEVFLAAPAEEEFQEVCQRQRDRNAQIDLAEPRLGRA
jgi:hypothetical protein